MPVVHLDTDIGGDMDDLCALALLLRWPGVAVCGITTAAELGGQRAGYAHYVLDITGRREIPVAAGADATLPEYRFIPEDPPVDVLWPAPVLPHRTPVEEALALLRHSIEAGATIIATGPLTNLRLLDEAYPGILAHANLVLMGGLPYPIRAGYPQWGKNMDYNFQVDVPSARYVLDHASPLLVPLTVTIETALRRSHLSRLRGAGPLGAVIARQAEAWLTLWPGNATYPSRYSGLPGDFINFLHDPLTCAVALGWDGVTIEEVPLAIEDRGGWLFERRSPHGKPFRVVRAVDGPRFDAFWLDVVTGSEAATRPQDGAKA